MLLCFFYSELVAQNFMNEINSLEEKIKIGKKRLNALQNKCYRLSKDLDEARSKLEELINIRENLKKVCLESLDSEYKNETTIKINFLKRKIILHNKLLYLAVNLRNHKKKEIEAIRLNLMHRCILALM